MQTERIRRLLEVLIAPAHAADLNVAEWSDLLREARRCDLMAWLGCRLADSVPAEMLPDKVPEHLEAAQAVAGHFERTVRWEVNRITHALRSLDCQVVLLKGAAYVCSDLALARGRRASDIDILVPKTRLSEVETALTAHGWAFLTDDEYDDRYYRAWMHELPPLRHTARGTVVDVHHAILPPTGRVHPDSQLLLDAARPLPGTPLFVLAPEDMVLHSAAHLFQDGDLAGGLRDLLDLDGLLRHFGGTEPGFWERLVPRAKELQLTRPLFYALRSSARLLRTPTPGDVLAAAETGRPSWPVLRLMDALIVRGLLPSRRDGSSWSEETARLLLYMRSHWLRMPAPLLARHLLHKAIRRWSQKSADEN